MFADFLAKEFNIIGMIGVAMVLVTYFLLQIDKLSQDSISFSLFNSLGSIFILVSLYFTWNLASGVIEIFWLLISAFGLVKSIILWRRRRVPS